MSKHEMCIVIYTHKHGTDAWVCRRDQARNSIYNVILESIEEIEEDEQKRVLQKMLKSSEPQTGVSVGDVCSLWSDFTEEYFEIRDVEQPGVEPDPLPFAQQRLTELVWGLEQESA